VVAQSPWPCSAMPPSPWTFCAGLMYLIQERQLKSRHPGRLTFRLPPLELLDDVAVKSVLFGFPLLTLAMISGSAWAEHVRGTFFTLRPREIWSILSWLIYAGLLYARVSAGWRGRKAAVLAILGFCFVLFAFLGVRCFGDGRSSSPKERRSALPAPPPIGRRYG